MMATLNSPRVLREGRSHSNASDFPTLAANFRIDKLSFEIPARQMVALVGPSGAGKSTTLDFISRFLVSPVGACAPGWLGHPGNFVLHATCARKSASVSQEPVLFEGTRRRISDLAARTHPGKHTARGRGRQCGRVRTANAAGLRYEN